MFVIFLFFMRDRITRVDAGGFHCEHCCQQVFAFPGSLPGRRSLSKFVPRPAGRVFVVVGRVGLILFLQNSFCKPPTITFTLQYDNECSTGHFSCCFVNDAALCFQTLALNSPKPPFLIALFELQSLFVLGLSLCCH